MNKLYIKTNLDYFEIIPVYILCKSTHSHRHRKTIWMIKIHTFCKHISNISIMKPKICNKYTQLSQNIKKNSAIRIISRKFLSRKRIEKSFNKYKHFLPAISIYYPSIHNFRKFFPIFNMCRNRCTQQYSIFYDALTIYID